MGIVAYSLLWVMQRLNRILYDLRAGEPTRANRDGRETPHPLKPRD